MKKKIRYNILSTGKVCAQDYDTFHRSITIEGEIVSMIGHNGVSSIDFYLGENKIDLRIDLKKPQGRILIDSECENLPEVESTLGAICKESNLKLEKVQEIQK